MEQGLQSRMKISVLMARRANFDLPRWRKGPLGSLPSPPFARCARFDRAQETSKSQEINVFSLSFLLPVK